MERQPLAVDIVPVPHFVGIKHGVRFTSGTKDWTAGAGTRSNAVGVGFIRVEEVEEVTTRAPASYEPDELQHQRLLLRLGTLETRFFGLDDLVAPRLGGIAPLFHVLDRLRESHVDLTDDHSVEIIGTAGAEVDMHNRVVPVLVP